MVILLVKYTLVCFAYFQKCYCISKNCFFLRKGKQIEAYLTVLALEIETV